MKNASRTILFMLILLAIALAGCQVFPYVFESATQTATQSERSTPTPVVTETMAPSSPTPVATDIAEAPTIAATEPPNTATPTSTPTPQFTLQQGNPLYLPNFAHPEAGCSWLGIAGQVFDEANLEVLGLTITLGDAQGEQINEKTTITGSSQAYGLGGYEIQISDTVQDSDGTYWVQVLNPEGVPLTPKFSFQTFADCEKNLVVLNFVPQVDSAASGESAALTSTPEGYP